MVWTHNHNRLSSRVTIIFIFFHFYFHAEKLLAQGHILVLTLRLVRKKKEREKERKKTSPLFKVTFFQARWDIDLFFRLLWSVLRLSESWWSSSLQLCLHFFVIVVSVPVKTTLLQTCCAANKYI